MYLKIKSFCLMEYVKIQLALFFTVFHYKANYKIEHPNHCLRIRTVRNKIIFDTLMLCQLAGQLTAVLFQSFPGSNRNIVVYTELEKHG